MILFVRVQKLQFSNIIIYVFVKFISQRLTTTSFIGTLFFQDARPEQDAACDLYRKHRQGTV